MIRVRLRAHPNVTRLDLKLGAPRGLRSLLWSGSVQSATEFYNQSSSRGWTIDQTGINDLCHSWLCSEPDLVLDKKKRNDNPVLML